MTLKPVRSSVSAPRAAPCPPACASPTGSAGRRGASRRGAQRGASATRRAVAQLLLQHLAGGVARQLRNDARTPWGACGARSPRGSAGRAPTASTGASPAGDHEGDRRARPTRASGRPTTAASRHGWVEHEHVLDLARVDVVAAADDHVLRPVDERQPAVRVEAAQVARVQPAPAQRLGAGLRHVQVARHHGRAVDHDLADLALRQLAVAGVDHADPHRDAGDAYGAKGVLVVRWRPPRPRPACRWR